MNACVKKFYWILFFNAANNFANGEAVSIPDTFEGVKRVKNPRSGTPNSAENPSLAGNLEPASAPIGRQPPFSPPFPMQGGLANPWLVPNMPMGVPNLPMGAPNLPMGANPAGWNSMMPQMPPLGQAPPFPQGSPFAQQPPPMGFPPSQPFWPQPSQWPFVETPMAGPPMGNPGGMPWGQQGPPLPPPPLGGGGPWQPPPLPPGPGIYSQWLPTSLGSAPVPPSPPWSAPGTIIGGPQLSPMGPWSAQPQPPIGYSPTANDNSPGQNAVPAYIRSAYDAYASQLAKNANTFSRSSQSKINSPRFFAADSQQQPTPMDPIYVTVDTSSDKWTNWRPTDTALAQTAYAYPVAPSPQVPPSNYQIAESIDPSPVHANWNVGGDGAVDESPTHQAHQAQAVAAPGRIQEQAFVQNPLLPTRGLGPNDELTISVPKDELQEQLQSMPPLLRTTPASTEATDDPYALNPNIIFGGPASMTFPELTIQVPRPAGLFENFNQSALSASSIRIGDILSFPQGTGFGAVPPPPVLGTKKGPSFSGWTTHDDPRGRNAMPFLERTSSGQQRKLSANNKAIKTTPIDPAPSETQNAAKTTTIFPNTILVAPQTSTPAASENNAPTSIDRFQIMSKNDADSIMETILREIQDWNVVLYGRTNCSVCVKTEMLLKNYSVPVHYVELKKETKDEQMLAMVQQMTHSLEMPLTFICGRFVGGHQRIRDLHINQQITPLLRECAPTKRRNKTRKGTKRVGIKKD